MNLSETFINRTKNILKEDFNDFLQSLDSVSPTSVRVNDKIELISSDEKVKWCKDGFYLPERPLFTADPFLHAGAYYVQEASSMFLCQVLEQLVSKESTVLDLSAAPGGKSTLISQYINEKGLLISNEIVRSRAYILAENLIKWGNDAVIVTNNEPKDFQQIPGFFDVVVVDAPCSGEGMFRKDPDSINEWSEQNVMMCAARQKDILKDVWEALKTNGILIYSTCTYNTDENEENVAWIEQELGAEFIPLNIDNFPEITATEKGYRFFPHKTKGEGFFIAALKKKSEVGSRKSEIKKQNKIPQKNIKTSKEVENLRNYLLIPEKWKIYQENNIISAFDKEKSEKLDIIKNRLKVLHFGITLAEQKGKDFIPHISLALSKKLNKICFPTVEVEYKIAISFLKKETIFLENAAKGFILLTYKNLPMGWVKNVGNRCNNLYPNEWRIRMKI
ncbi:Fmu (Sun) domain protein [uncultured Paludibacter sp.]|uniref:Fmu (Sun) domain protein n=1 Tax=uncultured Paludibacter sp. TaxID=497635 RepID=A0A653A5S7_9BACT|nr:Fmu (Sun) domain protein [uncultured Paludibacter sp.]